MTRTRPLRARTAHTCPKCAHPWGTHSTREDFTGIACYGSRTCPCRRLRPSRPTRPPCPDCGHDDPHSPDTDGCPRIVAGWWCTCRREAAHA